jgi:hypothetical protein
MEKDREKVDVRLDRNIRVITYMLWKICKYVVISKIQKYEWYLQSGCEYMSNTIVRSIRGWIHMSLGQ